MNGQLFFEIPNNQEVMAKLIEAIPSTWSWVDGCLFAPEQFIKSGSALENTGFAIQRFHSIHPTIIGRHDRKKGTTDKPDFFAIMVEQKLPGFVSFDESGYEAPITLDLAKRIAIGFLLKGYRGHLSFYKDCYRNSKYDNPARCGMILESWKGGSLDNTEAGKQPARVKLEWEGRYYGKKEDIEPIVAVCRSFNLREYKPVPTR